MTPSDHDLLNLALNTDCYKNLDDKEHNKVNLAMQGKPASTPVSNMGKIAFYLARRVFPINITSPPPPPPPPTKRYAPRSYNLASNNSDPRFCCHPEYGVVDKGDHYEDEMGCWYDKDHMFSSGGPGGYRDRTFMVAGLNESNNMNGKEPCEPYVSDTGLNVGGSAGYPGDPANQTGSYHK